MAATVDRSVAQPLRVAALGWALSTFFVLTILLCIAGAFVLPSHQMADTLAQLLPGFHWLSLGSVVLAVVEGLIYGWYSALVIGTLYNVLTTRTARGPGGL